MLYRRILKSNLFQSASWMVVSSFFTSLLRFLLIFILLRLYSQEEFGLWASSTSLAAILITGDFGITNVLRNIASKELERNNEAKIEQYYLSSVYFFLMFAIIASIVLLMVSPYIPYEFMFKTDNITLKEQGKLLFIVIQVLFLFGIPLGIGVSLFFSFNETKLYSLFTLILSVSTFIVVVTMSIFHINISIVSICYFVLNTFIYLCGSLYFMKCRHWHFRKIHIKVILENVREMLLLGVKFLVIQLSGSFIFNVLTLYSGAFLGLSIAANINIVQKIYTFFIGMYQSINNPIWSSLSQKYFTRKYAQCKKILYKTLIFSGTSFIIIILISYLYRDLLMLIVAGSQYQASGLLFVLIGAYSLVKVLFDNASLIQIASNNLNVLVVGYAIFDIFALVAVPKIVHEYGINLMLIAMTFVWSVFMISILINTNKILNYGKD